MKCGYFCLISTCVVYTGPQNFNALALGKRKYSAGIYFSLIIQEGPARYSPNGILKKRLLNRIEQNIIYHDIYTYVRE